MTVETRERRAQSRLIADLTKIAVAPKRAGRIETIMSALGHEEADALKVALAPGGPSAAAIADVLTANGHSISATTVKEYRSKLRRALAQSTLAHTKESA